MIQKLTLTGVVEIPSLQPPPAGNPLLIQMRALNKAPANPRVPLGPQQNFYERPRAAP